MKILLLSYKFHPDVGGIEINSAILAEYFVAFGAEVHVITTTQKESEFSFPYKVIRKPNAFALFQEFKWADIIMENNPTMHLCWPNLIFKRKRVTAICTWISHMERKKTWKNKLKMWWVNNADAVIAISKVIKDSIGDKPTVIGNPYRSELFNTHSLSNKKNKYFVFLGRLVSDKGCDLAIKLISTLNKERQPNQSPFNLTIIGNGPEYNSLLKLTNSLQQTEHISFLGELEGELLRNHLIEHKYILIPSRWCEPFGNVALEGMGCGCLPIVANGGGLVDAVGRAGIIFQRNDLFSLQRTVQSLLESPELEKKIRSEFVAHLKNHQPHFVARRYFDIIMKVYQNTYEEETRKNSTITSDR